MICKKAVELKSYIRYVSILLAALYFVYIFSHNINETWSHIKEISLLPLVVSIGLCLVSNIGNFYAWDYCLKKFTSTKVEKSYHHYSWVILAKYLPFGSFAQYVALFCAAEHSRNKFEYIRSQIIVTIAGISASIVLTLSLMYIFEYGTELYKQLYLPLMFFSTAMFYIAVSTEHGDRKSVV